MKNIKHVIKCPAGSADFFPSVPVTIKTKKIKSLLLAVEQNSPLLQVSACV